MPPFLPIPFVIISRRVSWPWWCLSVLLPQGKRLGKNNSFLMWDSYSRHTVFECFSNWSPTGMFHLETARDLIFWKSKWSLEWIMAAGWGWHSLVHFQSVCSCVFFSFLSFLAFNGAKPWMNDLQIALGWVMSSLTFRSKMFLRSLAWCIYTGRIRLSVKWNVLSD